MVHPGQEVVDDPLEQDVVLPERVVGVEDEHPAVVTLPLLHVSTPPARPGTPYSAGPVGLIPVSGPRNGYRVGEDEDDPGRGDRP
ncbi:hypothetical protein Misp04_00210 [Micromonospora sp. NBRC 101691]|nr:hypothetical protein Misp04_00210 [Micromonospora sp. NBRC 101691]